MFQNRNYQNEAIEAGLSTKNGILCLSTGSGKSICIKGLVEKYSEPTLILQPSSEILESNISKAHLSGLDATAYSASYGQKEISDTTYATIGSIIKNSKKLDQEKKSVVKRAEFKDQGFERFIGGRLCVDEAHLVNPEDGMYIDLIKMLKPKSVVGLTATPYRAYRNSEGTIMRMQTRTRPKFFKEISYIKSTKSLIDEGYLTDPEIIEIENNEDMLKLNSSGGDYTQKSLRLYEDENDLESKIIDIIKQVYPEYKSILVFSPSVDLSQRIVKRLNKKYKIAEINAKTKDRRSILRRFDDQEIKVVLNVGTLTTGYDKPNLECIIDARPIRSAALHYQKIGRIVRIFEGKKAVVFDLAGNFKRLDNPLKYKLLKNHRKLDEVYSPSGRITSRPVSEEPEWMEEMPCGKFKGTPMRMLPSDYISWYLKTQNNGPNYPALDMLCSEYIMRNWDRF